MKINLISVKGVMRPKCTNCGHVFDTDNAQNPYHETCRIALGKYSFCPVCGDSYEGCQVEGTDRKDCKESVKEWLNRGNK